MCAAPARRVRGVGACAAVRRAGAVRAWLFQWRKIGLIRARCLRASCVTSSDSFLWLWFSYWPLSSQCCRSHHGGICGGIDPSHWGYCAEQQEVATVLSGRGFIPASGRVRLPISWWCDRGGRFVPARAETLCPRGRERSIAALSALRVCDGYNSPSSLAIAAPSSPGLASLQPMTIVAVSPRSQALISSRSHHSCSPAALSSSRVSGDCSRAQFCGLPPRAFFSPRPSGRCVPCCRFLPTSRSPFRLCSGPLPARTSG